MLTVCFALYSSLVSVDPMSTQCMRMPASIAAAMAASCTARRDPFQTCEARRLGALNWVITVRKLEGV